MAWRGVRGGSDSKERVRDLTWILRFSSSGMRASTGHGIHFIIKREYGEYGTLTFKRLSAPYTARLCCVPSFHLIRNS